MTLYIGTKIVEAEMMNLGDYNKLRGWTIPEDEDPAAQGYKVTYEDGYVSWSPARAFRVYREISNRSTITKEDVDHWIDYVDCRTMGEKTTVVKVTMLNGFEIVESSSCVDPANYDEELGRKICMERIRNKIWELLGFLLQCTR